MELPSELVELARLPNDPEFASIKPPTDICASVCEVASGAEPSDALIAWIEEQRGLQGEAEEQLIRLGSAGELVDPASRGLPRWFLEKWAPVLHYRWSRDLKEAVESAKSWM